MATLTIPDSAYTTPDVLAQISQYDPDWVAGYQQGMAARALLPLPLNVPNEDWNAYIMRVAKSVYRPAAVGGWVSNMSTGWNNAMENGAMYLWTADPTDEHNVAS